MIYNFHHLLVGLLAFVAYEIHLLLLVFMHDR